MGAQRRTRPRIIMRSLVSDPGIKKSKRLIENNRGMSIAIIRVSNDGSSIDCSLMLKIVV